MKVIDLEQGSDEWLSWRKTVITATDASCIMGNNPWTSAYKCWQRKKGLIPEQKSNKAMEKGKSLEPEARKHFIDRFEMNMRPLVVESSEFDFLGASLDGISELGNHILEIKCGGEKLHSQASQGIIPQYYMDQIQHQLLVTRAHKAHYYSYYANDYYNHKDGIHIEVLPDPEFEAEFLPKAREFLRCLAFDEPPVLQDSDYKDMSEEANWRINADHYKKLCEEIKILEEVKDSYRKELIKMCGNQSCMGHGIKAMKTFTRGRIDYEAIPELKDINLDIYRKKSTEGWKFFTS